MDNAHSTGAAPVSQTDPLSSDALAKEKQRQQLNIELIASENIVSRAVLDALGHKIANKTSSWRQSRRESDESHTCNNRILFKGCRVAL